MFPRRLNDTAKRVPVAPEQLNDVPLAEVHMDKAPPLQALQDYARRYLAAFPTPRRILLWRFYCHQHIAQQIIVMDTALSPRQQWLELIALLRDPVYKHHDPIRQTNIRKCSLANVIMSEFETMFKTHISDMPDVIPQGQWPTQFGSVRLTYVSGAVLAERCISVLNRRMPPASHDGSKAAAMDGTVPSW